MHGLYSAWLSHNIITVVHLLADSLQCCTHWCILSDICSSRNIDALTIDTILGQSAHADRHGRAAAATIKSALLEYLKENDMKSVKTDAGTFYRTVKQKYWTSDWEHMHEFILEHKVPEFLDKRLNQKNVREFLEENPDLLPKGLNVDAEFALTIRKA